MPLTIAPGNQFVESVVSDGAGGMVAVWDSEQDTIAYTQKINNNGTINWPANGVMISAAKSRSSQVIADGNSNYLYSFVNDKAEPGRVVRAQKINDAGILQWGINGSTVCDNRIGQIGNPPSMVLSDNGGAIISWTDSRNFNPDKDDIYASKILSTGELAGTSSLNYTTIAGGDWNDPLIWSEGKVPPPNALVTVQEIVTVTADATCFSLSVKLPGAVLVKTGIKLTVTH